MNYVYEFSSRVLKAAAFLLLVAAMFASVARIGMAGEPGCGCVQQPCGDDVVIICADCRINEQGLCAAGLAVFGDCSRIELIPNDGCPGQHVEIRCDQCHCDTMIRTPDICDCY